jgi:hypothetical protein
VLDLIAQAKASKDSGVCAVVTVKSVFLNSTLGKGERDGDEDGARIGGKVCEMGME